MGTIGCEKGKKAEFLTRLFRVNEFCQRRNWNVYWIHEDFEKEYKMTRKDYQTWLLNNLTLHDDTGSGGGEEDALHGLAYEYITITLNKFAKENREGSVLTVLTIFLESFSLPTNSI